MDSQKLDNAEVNRAGNLVNARAATLNQGWTSNNLTPKKIKAYLADPSNGQRFIGHAIHRATESALQKIHRGRFDYNATRAFDFIDKMTGQAIELTTKKGVKTHRNRGADIVTYN